MSSEYSPEPKRELYRDPSRGKIKGVCAGLSDYFGVELWVVRIIAVTLLIFFQFPIFVAYIIAYFVLEPKPGTSKYDKHACIKRKIKSGLDGKSDKDKDRNKDNDPASASVQQVWKKGRVPGQKLRGLNQQFKTLENRLQSMETYVTSKQFELRKEFQNLST
ncbi:MAG: envelope stress response membrane protein PspC [Gammaproteobacteria bacterium]|nr:envelope stress response membrane protein PspC [Gammaproteobacteria bacterium]